MSSPTLIDDSNPAVQYSHNWTWVPNLVPEVDHTRHGVSEAGQTASLTFTGTGIQVFGTLESSDVAGQPTTQYAIDGSVVSTYTAPYTPSGPSVLNATFFSKLDLAAGESHEIVITNVNGTSPNMFWLDFFLVYTSPSQNPTGTGSSSGVTAVTDTPPRGTAPKTINVKTAGAIVGGVAGALVLVIVLLVAHIVRMKKRHRRSRAPLPLLHSPICMLTTDSEAVLIRPFNAAAAATTQDGAVPVPAVSPRRKAGSPPILPSPTTSESESAPSAPAMSSFGRALPISASRVNAASSTGAPSEIGAPTDGDDSASSTVSGAGLLARPSHRAGPEPSRSPEEALSLAQSLLHAVARGHGHAAGRQEQDDGPRLATDSGLRLYNEATLPPSYSSS